jgi:hypothetical protein
MAETLNRDRDDTPREATIRSDYRIRMILNEKSSLTVKTYWAPASALPLVSADKAKNLSSLLTDLNHNKRTESQ